MSGLLLNRRFDCFNDCSVAKTLGFSWFGSSTENNSDVVPFYDLSI